MELPEDEEEDEYDDEEEEEAEINIAPERFESPMVISIRCTSNS